MKDDTKKILVHVVLYAEFIVLSLASAYMFSIAEFPANILSLPVSICIVLGVLVVNHSIFRYIVMQRIMFVFESLLVITQIILYLAVMYVRFKA